MKRNINPIALLCSFLFNLLVLTAITGQVLTKKFTKEISVQPNPTITIESPSEMDYEMHAAMSSTYDEEKGYILRPGVKGESPCLIIRNYVIETWEKNAIKQEVTIQIIPDEDRPNEAQSLLDRLKVPLSETDSKAIFVAANLNIQKMELINGFFRRDRNTFILEDGSSYDVQQLVIQSTLFIPKKANVFLEKVVGHLSLGDLEGQLTINGYGGSIKGGDIRHLKANFYHFGGFFKKIERAEINAEFSKVEIQAIQELTIGTTTIITKEDNNLFGPRQREALSFSSNYRIEQVENLKITDSASDQFNLGEVQHFEALNSTFSNYFIKNLVKTLHLNGKNGDLTIYDVPASFQEIEIDNRISTVDINLKNVPNYQLTAYKNERNEFRLPKELQQATSNSSGKMNYWKGKKGQGGLVNLRCESCQVIIN